MSIYLLFLIGEFYFLTLSWLAHINPGRLGRGVCVMMTEPSMLILPPHPAGGF